MPCVSKAALKKTPKDAVNCGKSALYMQCWPTILNSWFSGTFFPPSFFVNQWYAISLEKWPYMNCSQMLQYNKPPVLFCPLFFSEKTAVIFLGFCSWKPIGFFTHNDTHRQTCLPLCSVCFPPESTPLGSIPVGVKPFSVSTLSLSSLQREKNPKSK